MIIYADRRTAERIAVSAPASLIFENDAVVNCTTIDLSRAGVKLLYPKGNPLPGDFRVSVPAARIRNRRARMVWRNGDELGIRFV